MPMVKYISFLLLFLTLYIPASAQSLDAKRYIIDGNQHYDKENFTKAELSYRAALAEDTNSIKANYNLGNTLYNQKKFDESRAHYDKVIQNIKATKADKHKAYHNIGKTYLDEKNPEKAVESFKEALKLDPYDDETRYNYALAKKLLQQQEEEKQQNQDEKNENDADEQQEKNDQQDNSPQDSQQNEEKGNEPNNQEQKPNDSDQQEGGQNGNKKGDGRQPQNQEITQGSDGKGESSTMLSKERQEGLLEALQKQEQETLKKIISQKAQKVRVNTEKDW